MGGSAFLGVFGVLFFVGVPILVIACMIWLVRHSFRKVTGQRVDDVAAAGRTAIAAWVEKNHGSR